MDISRIRAAAREAIAESIGHQVGDSEPIVSSGMIDSLSVVKFISLLEFKLGIRDPPPDNLQPDDFDTVELIIETVERVAKVHMRRLFSAAPFLARTVALLSGHVLQKSI